MTTAALVIVAYFLACSLGTLAFFAFGEWLHRRRERRRTGAVRLPQPSSDHRRPMTSDLERVTAASELHCPRLRLVQRDDVDEQRRGGTAA